ncbi:response regulator [Devosia faecipullorum]|uniref:response regulator n=1 Tax=Devosia faecipullorum TaxID=2755039 RepID=UPI00187BBF81|nr:response regulator [Devosia faecipullorum]MBE7732503.1 response regulator [Devosia faecipullorum]
MLAGKTVLVIETEMIIALSIETVLQGLGATDIVLLKSPDHGLGADGSWSGVALIVIEIEAGWPDRLELVISAREAGIPVIALTADGQLASNMAGLPNMPILVKPVLDDQLADAVRALLECSENQNE